MIQNSTESYMVRAFLTDAERRAVEGDEEMDQNNRSTHLANIKGRFGAMQEDARLLREHRPDLYEQLHEAVCEEEMDERIQRLENQVEELLAQREDDADG